MKIAKIVLLSLLGLALVLFTVHVAVNTDWLEVIRKLHSKG